MFASSRVGLLVCVLARARAHSLALLVLNKIVPKCDTFIKFHTFRPIFLFLGSFGHVVYDFESKLILISFFSLLKSTCGSPQGPSGDPFWIYFGCFCGVFSRIPLIYDF